MGWRAARMAGNRPPTSPTTSANATPWKTRAGLNWNENTTWVKLAPSVEVVKPSKMSQVATAPMMPPMTDKSSDSTSVPMKAGVPPKPIARRVAISTARAATDEYMVLRAPASAPNAIAMASGQPSFWIRSVVWPDCSA